MTFNPSLYASSLSLDATMRVKLPKGYSNNHGWKLLIFDNCRVWNN